MAAILHQLAELFLTTRISIPSGITRHAVSIDRIAEIRTNIYLLFTVDPS
jgi:hypothetical protein